MKLAVVKTLVQVHFEKLKTYRRDFLIGFVSAPIQFLFLVAFWSYVYRTFSQKTDIPTLNVTIAYYALLLIYDNAISALNISGKLSRDIFTGRIDVLLSKPISPLLNYAIEGYVRYLVFIPVYLIVYFPIAIKLGLKFDTEHILVAFLVLLASSTIKFLISSLLGLASVWTGKIVGITRIYQFIELILSGGFVPLYLYPEPLKSIATFLPFYYLAYVPVVIWIAPELVAPSTFVLLTVWIVVLLFLVHVITHRALSSYQSSYG